MVGTDLRSVRCSQPTIRRAPVRLRSGQAWSRPTNTLRRQTTLPTLFQRLIPAPMTPGQPPASSTPLLRELVTRQCGLAVKWSCGEDLLAAIRTAVANTTPAQIAGQPPARPMRPLVEKCTRQCGPAVR